MCSACRGCAQAAARCPLGFARVSVGGCSSRSPGSSFSRSVEMQRAREVMLRLWIWLRGAVVALEGCVGQCWGDRAARERVLGLPLGSDPWQCRADPGCPRARCLMMGCNNQGRNGEGSWWPGRDWGKEKVWGAEVGPALAAGPGGSAAPWALLSHGRAGGRQPRCRPGATPLRCARAAGSSQRRSQPFPCSCGSGAVG